VYFMLLTGILGTCTKYCTTMANLVVNYKESVFVSADIGSCIKKNWGSAVPNVGVTT